MIEWEVISQEAAWQIVRIPVLTGSGGPGLTSRGSAKPLRCSSSGGKVHEELAVPGPSLGAADSADRASSCTNCVSCGGVE